MYQRAQMMYQFNTTSNLIALAQGCLILTYYCSGREPVRKASDQEVFTVTVSDVLLDGKHILAATSYSVCQFG